MNPFHVWLGLPETSANPNHYQLLGIKASEQDTELIEQAVRQCLSRLAAVTPDENHVDAYEKIKQRIGKAGAIVTNEATRSEYDAKLLTKLAERKRSQAASASSRLTPAQVKENLSTRPSTEADVVSIDHVHPAARVPLALSNPQFEHRSSNPGIGSNNDDRPTACPDGGSNRESIADAGG